jgi:hypothetical protein
MRDQIKFFFFIALFIFVLRPLPMQSQARLTMRAGMNVCSKNFSYWDYAFYYQGQYLDTRPVYVASFYNSPTFQVGLRSALDGHFEGGYGISVGKASIYSDPSIATSTVYNRHFIWVDYWLRNGSKIDVGIGSQIAMHTMDVLQRIKVYDYELQKSIKYQVGTRWNSKGYELAFISRRRFGKRSEHAIHFSLGLSAQLNDYVRALHESGYNEPIGVQQWGSGWRTGLMYAYIFGQKND